MARERRRKKKFTRPSQPSQPAREKLDSITVWQDGKTRFSDDFVVNINAESRYGSFCLMESFFSRRIERQIEFIFRRHDGWRGRIGREWLKTWKRSRLCGGGIDSDYRYGPVDINSQVAC
jgi:hypothetical protein